MKKSEYSSYDGLGIAKLIREKEVNVREVLDTAVSIIETYDEDISAITTKAYDHAIRAIEKSQPENIFHGVPFLLKDLNVSCEGLPTTLSSKLFENNIAKNDSYLIKLYKKAGLIVLGLTKTPELALSLTTEPKIFGPTKNPLKKSNSPGGSSGGSAASIRQGYVPIAHATDGGGSIRVPAALCGLFGLKPSRGRVSSGPDLGEALGGMAISHCLSKSVRDSAALLDISSELMPGEPYVSPKQNGKFLDSIHIEPKNLKIGFMTHDFEGNRLNSDIIQLTKNSAQLCETLGHHVEEINIDLSAQSILEAWKIIPAINLLNNLENRAKMLGINLKESDLEPLNWAWMNEGRKYTAVDYLRAINNMHKIGRIMADYFEKYDLILSPTVNIKELPLGTVHTDHTDVDRHLNLLFREIAPHTAIFNQTGGPAMSIPMQVFDDGTPAGMHFAAKIGDESTLISLAAQIEKYHPWDCSALNHD